MGGMARGFAFGSLVLIALYVISQPGASRKSELASNALVQGMRRLFSSQVAGIGDHSKTVVTAPSQEGGHSKVPTSSDIDSLQGKLFTT